MKKWRRRRCSRCHALPETSNSHEDRKPHVVRLAGTADPDRGGSGEGSPIIVPRVWMFSWCRLESVFDASNFFVFLFLCERRPLRDDVRNVAFFEDFESWTGPEEPFALVLFVILTPTPERKGVHKYVDRGYASMLHFHHLLL